MKFQREDDNDDTSIVSEQDDNHQIITHVLNFYHKVRGLVNGDANLDTSVGTDIICGTVYSVLNPSTAKIMRLLMQPPIEMKLPLVRRDNAHREKITYRIIDFFSNFSNGFHTLDSVQNTFLPFFFENLFESRIDVHTWARMLSMNLYIGLVENFIPTLIRHILDTYELNTLHKNAISLLYELLIINYEEPLILEERKTELDFRFVELIPDASELATVRDVFNILPPPERLTVFRGPYTLCQVEVNSAIGRNNDSVAVYKIIKNSPLSSRTNYINDLVVLKRSVFDEPEWITIQQGLSQEAKNELILQEILSKKRYARIASWNVACMNNFDLPTTQLQLDLKLTNIARVIINSNCDIVALQELPYIITLQEETSNMQEETSNIDRDEPRLELELDNTDHEALNNQAVVNAEQRRDINRTRENTQTRGAHRTQKTQKTQKTKKTKKTPKTFDYIREQLVIKLKELSNDSWNIQWSRCFYDNYDARKGRGVLAFAYNSDVVQAQQPQDIEFRIDDRRSTDNRIKRMPIYGSFRIGKLDFILVNVHLNPKDAIHEANDLTTNLIPKLQERQGHFKAQSVIFLGDFNLSYTTRGTFAKPKPDDNTWNPLIQNGFMPCIKDTFTNVVQSCCYDNIWIHKSMASVLHNNPKALGLEEKGVKEITHILEPGRRLLKSDMKAFFQKQASDHNLVFIDLRIHKVMPWSENIRFEENVLIR
jgi:hypothetical protein